MNQPLAHILQQSDGLKLLMQFRIQSVELFKAKLAGYNLTVAFGNRGSILRRANEFFEKNEKKVENGYV